MRVNHLHIEASSHCNARCPGCLRNGYGFPLEGFFKASNLATDQLREILKRFPEVTSINYCGNHGDPMMNPGIAEMCDLKGVTCSIATNGSIGKISTYEKIAQTGTKITFGIDGLSDTNHLYRQGVIWDNLMVRARAFIEAGGQATWQFIMFQHNMHQVQQAKRMSEIMGFKDFCTVDVGRNNMPAIQPDKTVSHWILPPDMNARPTEFDVEAYLEMRYNPVDFTSSTQESIKISCEHLDGSVYVNSEGEFFPCCYHGFGHVDRPKVYLEEFEQLKSTWKTKNCNQVCAESCSLVRK